MARAWLPEEGGAAGGLLSKPKFWLKVKGDNAEGVAVEGWAERGPIFVQDATRSDTATVVNQTVTVYTAPDATRIRGKRTAAATMALLWRANFSAR